ncbi:DUF3040 domain-containing protein [Yinghuangia sp. ASG 101]|uniref:DUF3040 domain-containing protein n=1 Tax=Yinghuangia sp. ASG 101 TaxID=2896848 RepID=UPI001E40FB66|nr:DUF3040 domain-containing protein [Yinghuangia sp. ASG 101]UGQ12929.1 DUF3040 domain-containing protein [Yinghuangia sp. ASG 101]
MPGGPALSRRERQQLHAIELELQRDAVLDRQLRTMNIVNQPRSRQRSGRFRKQVRVYCLIVLAPLSLVMLAATLGGATLSIAIAAIVVWAATLVIAADALWAWWQSTRHREPG